MDGCIHDGTVDPAAAEIVTRLDSYTELSPSGTGLHVIVNASLNGGRKSTRHTPWGNGEPYEFATFTAGKYFTVTGDRLPGTPAEIHDRQAQLDAIRAEIFGPAPTDPAAIHAAAAAASSTDTTPPSERSTRSARTTRRRPDLAAQRPAAPRQQRHPAGACASPTTPSAPTGPTRRSNNSSAPTGASTATATSTQLVRD